MAVVKADGYGHGLVPVARAALDGGRDVARRAHSSEALALRDAGITAPVLTWLFAPGADVGGAIDPDIDVTVGAPGRSTPCWPRPGGAAVPPASTSRSTPGWPQRPAHRLARHGATPRPGRGRGRREVTGVWSHFAYADAPAAPDGARAAGAVRRGLRRARAGRVAAAAPPRQLRGHADQPVGLLRPRTTRHRRLRPLAGARPRRRADFGLREAMRVTARLAVVKRAPGRAGRQLRARVLHAPRHRARARAGGLRRRHPALRRWTRAAARRWRAADVAGRVCMDQVVVDLGPGTPGRPATRSSSSAARPTASPRRRTGPRPPGRSTTRS